MNNLVLHPYSLNNSITQNIRIEDSSYKLSRDSFIPSLQTLTSKDHKDQQVNFIEKNSPTYEISSRIHSGNKRYGSSYEIANSLTNPFSTPELDDNVRLTNTNNQNNQHAFNNYQQNSPYLKGDNVSQVLQLNNLSTIKVKSYSGSYISNGSSTINIQGILKKQYEGAREGQDQRQKLFTVNEELLHKNHGKLIIEESPVAPDNLSLSDKLQLSSQLNNQLFLQAQGTNQNQQQIISANGHRKQESIYEKTIKSGTLAFTQYKQRQQLWIKKWMVMSLFISKQMQNFKKKLILSKINYLTKQQISLINDKSAHYDKLRENKEKRYQGWLYDSQGCCSRRNKKRILILLKKIKNTKNCFLRMFKSINERIYSFDQKFPPFSPLLTALKIFDFFMLFLTIFNAFFIPLYICFNKQLDESEGGKNAVFILNKISPFIFIIDILKYLNTGCFIRGQIITERIQIFKKYIRERLICDLISIITLITYQNNQMFHDHFILVLFYFRFYFGLHVIGKIRESFLLKDKTHAIINILILIFFVFFFAHVFACSWYFIGLKQYENSKQSWIEFSQIQNASFQVQYINSIHFAFSSISTLNTDIIPQTQLEKIFLILINFVSFGLIGYIFNEAHQIFKTLSLKRKNYLRQLKQINRQLFNIIISKFFS